MKKFAIVSILVLAAAAFATFKAGYSQTSASACGEISPVSRSVEIPETAFIILDESDALAKLIIDAKSLMDAAGIDKTGTDALCPSLSVLASAMDGYIIPALKNPAKTYALDVLWIGERDEYGDPTKSEKIGSANLVKEGSSWKFSEVVQEQ